MLSVAVTPTDGRSFEFTCDSCSFTGSVIVARYLESKLPDALIAADKMRSNRTISVDASTDFTLVVAVLPGGSTVDFSSIEDSF